MNASTKSLPSGFVPGRRIPEATVARLPVYLRSLLEMAEAKGYTCDYRPLIKPDEAMQIIGDYAGLVIRSKFRVDKAVLDAATNLQFIARAGAGMDNIDEDYAT